MSIIDPTFQMWAVLAIVAGAIILYATEKLIIEVTSLLVIATLLLLFQFAPVRNLSGDGLIGPRQLLSGFADPALIAILALLVMGQGLVRAGALDGFSDLLARKGQNFPRLVTIFALIVVMLLSGFMNNTPVVVIFIPILSALAQRLDHTVSHLLMPLSFAAILGGNLTLIGSSTNLLVSGTMEQITGTGIDFFEITVLGGILAAIGFLYVYFISPFFLRDRAGLAGEIMGASGKQFMVQLEVTSSSSLNGVTARAGMFPGLQNLTVSMVQRGEEALLPPFDDLTLQPGDVLVIAATRDALTDILKTSPDLFEGFIDEHSGEDVAPADLLSGQQILAEVVVAPASRMDGRTLSQIAFHGQTSCIVLGIQRRSRMYRTSLNRIRLEAGDVLLVLGQSKDVKGLRANRDVLLMEWSASDVPMKDHSLPALLIFGATVLAAATSLLPIATAALIGAAAMIVTGCLNIRQAVRSIDRRIVLIVAAALAMGVSMEATGGAAYLAHTLVDALEGASTEVVLSAFFLMIAFLTNVLSNNATAVLFTPIALSVAASLNAPVEPFVVAVILAANCSFATPIGYQTNLLVMGPGHYQFVDFIKAGVPLIFIIWAVFTTIAPWYYEL